MNMHGRNSSAAGIVLKDILPTLAQEAHGGIPLTFNNCSRLKLLEQLQPTF